MNPALQLTQFCILKKDSQHAKFSFHLNGYSNVKTHCISRRFWFAGNYWKLQISKKSKNFGMFLRWYGPSQDTETNNDDDEDDNNKPDFWCKASLLFSVVNIIHRHLSVTEGKRDQKEIFEKVSHGIGYGKILSLEELESTPGYFIDDTVYLQLQMRVYETGYKDMLWCTPTSKRGTSEGVKFSFYGTDWKLVLFPHGETKDGDNDEAGGETTNNRELSNEDKGENNNESNKDNEEMSDNLDKNIENEAEKDIVEYNTNNVEYDDENDDNLDNDEDNAETDVVNDDENAENDFVNDDDSAENDHYNTENTAVNADENDGDDGNKDKTFDNDQDKGEDVSQVKPSEHSASNENEGSRMSAIYLLRCGDDSESELRYNVIFKVSVDVDDDLRHCKEIVLNQHFHHRISNAYGTDLFLASAKVDSLRRIKVTVAFKDVVPYYYFGVPLDTLETLDENSAPNNFLVNDQFGHPWSFYLNPEDNKICGYLGLDPNKENREIKSLIRRNKFMQVCWVAEMLSPTNIEQSVLFTTKSRRQIKDVVFTSNRQQDVIEFPVSLSELNEENFPLTDANGLLSIRLSIYCCNYVTNEHGQLLLSFNSMEKIVEEIRRTTPMPASVLSFNSMEKIPEEMRHTTPMPVLETISVKEEKMQYTRPSSSRRKVKEEESVQYNNTPSPTKSEEIKIKKQAVKYIPPSSTTSAMVVQTDEDSVLVQSLVDHLDSYDQYIKNLEKNPKKAKAIHDYVSITSLIESSRPTDHDYKHLSLVARSLERVVRTLPLDIEKILHVGALGQGTVVANNLGIDLVVFLKDFAEQKHRLRLILRVMKERIKEKSSKDATDRRLYRFKREKRLPYVSNFYHTTNGLLFKLGHVNTTIVLSQGFKHFKSHHDIYKKAANASQEQLHQYVVMTSYLQLAFVSEQPLRCKDLICVVKAWSNDVSWELVDMRPSSYLLTLLVIHAFETVAKLNVARTPSFDKEVLVKFGANVADPKLRVEWDTYYKPSDYTNNVGNNKKNPFIRDPAIPFHNVAETGIVDWSQFRRETEAWVESLTF